ARARLAGEVLGQAGDRLVDDDGALGPAGAHGGGEGLDGGAGQRRLAGGVDVGEDDEVGGVEAGGEAVEVGAHAAVAVGLEHGDEAPVGVAGARAGEGGADLGGVVAVVVDDHDVAGGAAHGEAPLDAAELGERGG